MITGSQERIAILLGQGESLFEPALGFRVATMHEVEQSEGVQAIRAFRGDQVPPRPPKKRA